MLVRERVRRISDGVPSARDQRHRPGARPDGVYHAESNQEAFLVLGGVQAARRGRGTTPPAWDFFAVASLAALAVPTAAMAAPVDTADGYIWNEPAKAQEQGNLVGEYISQITHNGGWRTARSPTRVAAARSSRASLRRMPWVVSRSK